MTILYILYGIAFIITIICFPAINNIDVRRRYGRIFNTRIDTNIYKNIFYISFACIIILYLIIQIL